jgi:hypothetical protein
VTRSDAEQLLQAHAGLAALGLLEEDPLGGAVVTWVNQQGCNIAQVVRTIISQHGSGKQQP